MFSWWMCEMRSSATCCLSILGRVFLRNSANRFFFSNDSRCALRFDPTRSLLISDAIFFLVINRHFTLLPIGLSPVPDRWLGPVEFISAGQLTFCFGSSSCSLDLESLAFSRSVALSLPLSLPRSCSPSWFVAALVLCRLAGLC